MNGCADKTMLLHALLDGELDAVNAVAIEAHLKSCADCAAEWRRLQELRRQLTKATLSYPVPDELRDRVFRASAQSGAGLTGKRRNTASWVAISGIAAIAASLLLIVTIPQMATTRMEDQVIDDHIRSLRANHLVDVATSDQHVVKPWFNGKVNFTPPVIELASQGFPLAGGRLDYLEGRIVPVLVYRRRLHSINVFIRPASASVPPHDIPLQRHGYSLAHWSHNGLECWAVSDIDPQELALFQRRFEAQLS